MQEPLTVNDFINQVCSLQDKMGYLGFINESLENRLDYTRDVTLALIKEATEMLDELPWKPWKSLDEQTCNGEKAADEVTDIFVFAAVLYMIIKPQESLEERLVRTLSKINERISNGYSHQIGGIK